MPAIASRLPFGLARSSIAPVGRAVAEPDPALALERAQRLGVGLVAPLAVRDRELPHLAQPGGERALARHLDEPVAALEALAHVARERAGEQARLGEDSEAVADAEHVSPALGVRANRPDDGARLGDGARPQVVAVAEAARNRDESVPAGSSASVCHTTAVGAPHTSRKVWTISASALEPGKTTTQARMAKRPIA